jgi:hypothetical protein
MAADLASSFWAVGSGGDQRRIGFGSYWRSNQRLTQSGLHRLHKFIWDTRFTFPIRDDPLLNLGIVSPNQ